MLAIAAINTLVVNIENTTFSENKANMSGSALYLMGGEEIHIKGCTIIENKAKNGAVFSINEINYLNIEKTKFINNFAF